MYDIERSKAGSDEINRKSRLIKWVLSNLLSLVQRSGQRWKVEAVIFSVPVGESIPLSVVAGKHRFAGKDDVFVRFGNRDFVDFDSELNFHYQNVPDVYQALPVLLEAADAAVPNAKVKEFFSFFAEQAPTSSR